MRYLLIILFLLGCENICDVPANPVTDDVAEIFVTRVIDGDTFAFEFEDDEYKVRLADFDAYEVRRGNKLSEQAKQSGISEDSALALGFIQKYELEEKILLQLIIIYRVDSLPNFDNFGRLLRIMKLN